MSTPGWDSFRTDIGEVEVIVDFPPVGAEVEVVEQYRTREVGEDDEVVIEAGAVGVVEGYVVEWCDVHVKVEGLDVWVCPLKLRPWRST